MQYHLNGFQPGDPAQASATEHAGEEPDAVDVLIVGCGPAGLTLAAQLSVFPDIVTRIVDQKSGPLKVGQADGIACRSMEMFEAFGFAEKVAKEAYWVNETTFWRPAPNGTGLARADRIQDVEDGLSEFPHTILSQARVHDFYLDLMKNGPHRLEPHYNRRLVDLRKTTDPDFPVTATFECGDDFDTQETIRARYIVGCDGARSGVRKSLGHELKGEAARQLWGVMDVLAVTNFPDIRLKSAIQSADQGSLLIIPREGGYMVRMYIELDALVENERASDRNVTPDGLIDKARAILDPFDLDVKDVAWWSAYEIGQRVCDAFDDVQNEPRGAVTPRIFIAGDACHTHSPKAGQGMNVSMADTFNLGWKLAAVLLRRADPGLLHTYSAERHAKAQELIEFDRQMARLFSAKPRDDDEAAEFQRYFKKHGRYTAGVETRYSPSIITGAGTHQNIATGFTVGTRFHSSPVIRLADAKPLHLGHILKADGRWRLIAFAGSQDNGQPGGAIARLCEHLSSNATSLLSRYTPNGADIDSVIDLRAVFQANHRSLDVSRIPLLLRPTKGRYGLVDYEKAFCPDVKDGPDVFDHRGIDRGAGALVIVRPDQFVADVLPLDAYEAMAAFFDGFMRQIPDGSQ
ncbi:FAD-dependent monooxygenase [Litoreibacter roseus]|uniref:Phenol 2-monooxygenase n=1 Tax=Litoreibacter roseus TaxID=2601869 RepID=A0A6N6JGI3_9RHOB|nr:FAD-dependent monooxygenase [Litoreibacter roseus]GFE64940.1 phenol 2-monooxygenase [Litoreibacter roseus]